MTWVLESKVLTDNTITLVTALMVVATSVADYVVVVFLTVKAVGAFFRGLCRCSLRVYRKIHYIDGK